MAKLAAIVAVAALGVGFASVGCSGGNSGLIGEETSAGSDLRVPADAFLFDAQLRRDGKPTSVRLELYHTDSVTGVSGRGYFGKGALKGRLADDSITVYFPSTGEYVRDAVRALLTSDECSTDIPDLPLASLLVRTPDSVGAMVGVSVAADYSDDDRPTFVVTMPGCPWRIDVVYDRHDEGWRVREFYFDDGHETVLKSRRRTYKHGADVPRSRFKVDIPPAAVRIIP